MSRQVGGLVLAGGLQMASSSGGGTSLCGKGMHGAGRGLLADDGLRLLEVGQPHRDPGSWAHIGEIMKVNWGWWGR